jgi:hypothetical protein
LDVQKRKKHNEEQIKQYRLKTEEVSKPQTSCHEKLFRKNAWKLSNKAAKQ